MRRLAILSLIALLLAVPAAAQDGDRIAPPRAADAPALRGPAGEAPAEGEAETGSGGLAALVPVPPPVAPVGARVTYDGRQCRRTCHRDYYFCLSAEEETCAPTWTKCMAGCG